MFRPLREAEFNAVQRRFKFKSCSNAPPPSSPNFALVSLLRLKFRMYPRGQSMLLKSKVITTEKGIVLAAKSKIGKKKVLVPGERFLILRFNSFSKH